ncbi:MAG: hypothetical protein NC217_01805 [Muribaculaceae bacterium]|nr:hypothetical protein [Muribaculaceae bacterium]
MQSISLHIEYLLRHHECVILPGIGAFLRTYKGAAITQQGEVTAPATQICFNSSIIASDGLLCHSIARREKLSFEEASVYVSKIVEECKAALECNKELSIGHLGRLHLDDEQRISFLPYTKPYASLWSSFSPLTLTDKVDDKITEQEVQDTASDKDYYIIRISRKAVRYAAIAAVCLFTAATLMLPSASRTGVHTVPIDKQYASVVPGVEKLSAPSKELSAKSVKTAPMVEEVETSAATETSTSTEEKDYYLIVATFKNEADCRKFIAEQKDKEDLNIISSGKVSRVYSAASNDRDELLDRLNSDAHHARHPQAWIWKNPAAIY